MLSTTEAYFIDNFELMSVAIISIPMLFAKFIELLFCSIEITLKPFSFAANEKNPLPAPKSSIFFPLSLSK